MASVKLSEKQYKDKNALAYNLRFKKYPKSRKNNKISELMFRIVSQAKYYLFDRKIFLYSILVVIFLGTITSLAVLACFPCSTFLNKCLYDQCVNEIAFKAKCTS
jgi:cellulose synthase/poly-beta-1,6-N-acetylglucosamine synthase-like glycosyltransferase